MKKSGSRRKLKNRSQRHHSYQTRSRTSSLRLHQSSSSSPSDRVKRKASPESCSIGVSRRRSLKKVISSKKLPRTSSSSSSSSTTSSTSCSNANRGIEKRVQNAICRCNTNNDDNNTAGPSRICKPKRKTKLKPPKSKLKSKGKAKSRTKVKSKSQSKRKSKPESSNDEKQNETEEKPSSSSDGKNKENVTDKEVTHNNNTNDSNNNNNNSNEIDPNTMFNKNGCFIAHYEWMNMIKSPMDPNIYQIVRFPNKLVALLISKNNPLDLDLTLPPDPKTFCHPQVQLFNEKFIQMHQDLGKDPDGQNLLEKVISFPWTLNVDTIPDKDIFFLNENNNNSIDKDKDEWFSEDKKPKYNCAGNSRPCGSSSASTESGENPEIEIESDLPRGPKYGISICVMAGAINDPKEYPGMAHLTEHCVFEGTKKYANSSNILFDSCTIVNASTERDRTVYYAHVESWATLQTVIPIMADMMTSPLLMDEIICSEISIVDSESCIRQSFESVRCHDLLCSLSKENDQLRLYACGDLSTLNKPGIIPALRNWHAKYYRPSNMIVSIEGPVPIKDLLRVVAINFYNIPGDTVHPKINTDENTSASVSVSVSQSRGQRSNSNSSAKPKVKKTASSKKVKACASLLAKKKKSSSGLGMGENSGFGRILELDLPFDLQTISRVYIVNPFQDSQEMILTWILSPDAWLNYSTKPLTYIATLLGRQGEGSLHSYLLNKGYIISCRSYHTNQFYYTNCYKYSSLIIKFELTKDGLNNSAEVLKAVFSYIRMLRQAGPKRRIFDELRTKSAHLFHFRCEQFKTAQLLAVALNIMKLQKGGAGTPKLAMTASVLLTKYDPTLIAHYLEQLTLDNLNIMLVSPTFASLTTHQHPNILTEFGVMDLSPELKYELSKIRPYMDFTLPPPNVFVDEDICRPIRNTLGSSGFGSISGCGDKLALERSMLVKEVTWKLTCSGKATIVCHHIDSSEWEGPRRPETATFAFLITSGQGQSPNSSAINSAMMDLWVDLLRLKVKERFYPAVLADIKFDIAVADNGISVYIDGQSKWLPTIWFGILEEFVHFERNMGRNRKLWEDFKIYQEKMYGNSILDAETYAYDLKLWLTSCSHNLSTYLQQILADLTFEEFIEFTRSFKCRMWIFVQLFGCVEQSRVEQIASSILKLDYSPLSARELARNHTFVIPRGDRCLRVKARTDKCHNSFIINCYQFGCLSYEDEIICQILVRRITPFLFNHIRTKEQIGYRVWTLYENSYSVSSIEIWVNTQPDKFTTGYVDERIDDGLACFYKENLCSDEKIREVFKIQSSPPPGGEKEKDDDDGKKEDDEDDDDDEGDDDESKGNSATKETDNNTKSPNGNGENQGNEAKSDSSAEQSQSQGQDKKNQNDTSTSNSASDSNSSPKPSTSTNSKPSTSAPSKKSSNPGKKNVERSSTSDSDDLNRKKRGSRYTKERAEDLLIQREILGDPDFPSRVRALYRKNLPTSVSSEQNCIPLYKKISIQVVGRRRFDDSSPKEEQFLEEKLEKFRRVNGDLDKGDGDGGGKGNRKSGGSVALDIPDCVSSKDRSSNSGYFITDPNAFRRKLMIHPNLYE